ncbi:VOC family protein [Nocardia inohanensis]|uniref:VOC family protein n=1 Tax=Nocardia inohanensis TaxID=209246 RepID=UPI000829B5EC|nr:glyoxalase [Nocardia inohanensis]
MSEGMQTIIYPVKDLAAAKAQFNTLLGQEPSMDTEYYVGYSVNGQDIGLDPNGDKKGMTGPVAYAHVGDIEKSLAALIEAGATEREAIREVGPGRRIATVDAVDGTVLGLLEQR